MTAGIFLEYKGAPVPIEDLRWQIIAPCGCTSGVMTVEMGGGFTPDEAKASFNAGIVKLIKADPHMYVLTSNADFPWEAFKTGRCPHIPKYGIEPRPTPTGYEWRAAGTTAHLCPCTSEAEQFYVSQVCSDRYIRLSPVKFGVAMTVPCKKCIAWANTRQTTAVVAAS